MGLEVVTPEQSKDLTALMVKAVHRIPDIKPGATILWRMHPDVAERIQQGGYWDFSKGPMTDEAFDAMVKDLSDG